MHAAMRMHMHTQRAHAQVHGRRTCYTRARIPTNIGHLATLPTSKYLLNTCYLLLATCTCYLLLTYLADQRVLHEPLG